MDTQNCAFSKTNNILAPNASYEINDESRIKIENKSCLSLLFSLLFGVYVVEIGRAHG